MRDAAPCRPPGLPQNMPFLIVWLLHRLPACPAGSLLLPPSQAAGCPPELPAGDPHDEDRGGDDDPGQCGGGPAHRGRLSARRAAAAAPASAAGGLCRGGEETGKASRLVCCIFLWSALAWVNSRAGRRAGALSAPACGWTPPVAPGTQLQYSSATQRFMLAPPRAPRRWRPSASPWAPLWTSPAPLPCRPAWQPPRLPHPLLSAPSSSRWPRGP